MSDFFSALEQQLREVASRPAVAPAPAPARRNRTRSALARGLRRRRTRLVLVIVLTLALAGVAAAANWLWRPVLGLRGAGFAPTISSTTPPQSQLDMLAVLRRPQTRSDRSAVTQHELEYLGFSDSGVRTDYIRLLELRDPGGIVLVPVAELRGAHGFASPALSHAPGIRDALCLIYPDIGGAAKLCFSTAQVLDGEAVASLGRREFGLVPDGVASVTLELKGGRTETARVRENLFDAQVPGALSPGPLAVRWTLRDGTTRTFRADDGH